MVPIRPLLEGRAEMLFVDRPGHGWSERAEGLDADRPGAGDRGPDGLPTAWRMRSSSAIPSGGPSPPHSLLGTPKKTRGLVFLAAATHPWPGAATSWYYEVAAMPVIGRLFAETLRLARGRDAHAPGLGLCLLAQSDE